jgi:hypothetical protein
LLAHCELEPNPVVGDTLQQMRRLTAESGIIGNTSKVSRKAGIHLKTKPPPAPPLGATAIPATRIYDSHGLQCESSNLIDAQMASKSGYIGHFTPDKLDEFIQKVKSVNFESWKAIVNAECTDWQSWTLSILAEPSLITKMRRIDQYFKLSNKAEAIRALLAVLRQICMNDADSEAVIRSFMQTDVKSTTDAKTSNILSDFIRSLD